MIRFNCPACRKPYRCPERMGGKSIRCAGCGRAVPVPMPLPDEDLGSERDVRSERADRGMRTRITIAASTGAVLVIAGALTLAFRPSINRPPAGSSSAKTDGESKTSEGSATKKDTQSQQIRLEQDAALRYGPAVALIEGPKRGDDLARRGSGVLVAPELVVTSSRAIREYAVESLRVSFGDGASVKAVLLFEDPRLDLAVLRIPPAGIAPLQLGTNAPKPGSAVVTLGYPTSAAIDGGERRVHAQQVSVLRSDQPTRCRLEMVRTPVAGGPLLNNAGEVVGVLLDVSHVDGPARRPDLVWAATPAALRSVVEKAKQHTAAEIAKVVVRHDRFRFFAHFDETWQVHRRCLFEAVGQAREAAKDGAALQEHLRNYRRVRSAAQDESPYECIDPSLAHQRDYEGILGEMSRHEAAADDKLADFRTAYLKLRLLYLSPPSVTAAEFERRVADLDSALKTQWEAALQDFAAEE
jgi:S1-C subfamily serine protease